MTEQRPRMQSRPIVVPLRQGDAVVFAVHNRPVQGLAARIASISGTASAASGRDTVIRSVSFSTTHSESDRMTLNLFDRLAPVELRQEQLGPGARVLRQFAVGRNCALVRLAGCRCQGAIPPYDHAGRFSHVCCYDQLRFARLGDGSNRLSLRPRRSAERPALAADGGCFFKARNGRGRACRIQQVRS